jgi:hypothetical protein
MLEFSPGWILLVWALAITIFNADAAATAAPFIIMESVAVVGYILATKRKLG